MNWGCICFDLDNTLLNYETAFKKGMHYTFNHFFDGKWNNSKKMNPEEWFITFKTLSNDLWNEVETKRWTKQEYKENRFILSLKHFDVDANKSMAHEFQTFFYSIVHQFVEPYDGVYSLLEKLNHRKLPYGLITNGESALQYRKLHSSGLCKWFNPNHIFISGECGVAKPNGEIFKMAQQTINLSPFPSLFIGDSWELDIIGAMDAGWETVYVNTRNAKPTTLHQPIEICNTIKELGNILFD